MTDQTQTAADFSAVTLDQLAARYQEIEQELAYLESMEREAEDRGDHTISAHTARVRELRSERDANMAEGKARVRAAKANR